MVTGPVAIKPPMFVKVVPIESAEDMFRAVTGAAPEQDIIIKAAAVADYRPAVVARTRSRNQTGICPLP